MLHCDHCKARLPDYVFGLLDGNDLQETRAHLDACSECQAALEEARKEQTLLARAARAITEVAEFALPTTEAAPTLPATVPMAAPASPGRPMWRRGWVAWSAAAAVLLAVGTSFTYYRATVRGHRELLAEKSKAHKESADRFAALPVQHNARHRAVVAEARAGATPYLHVVGPTTLLPGAKGHVHITSFHPEGPPRQVKDESLRSNLRVKLIEADTNKVVQVTRPKADDDGLARVEIDPGNAPAGSTFRVLVEADTGADKARVEETVRIAAPTYVTRIDTNKIAYQIKDVLFFRVLVLDRFTLRPPGQPIPMRVELLSPQGQAVRSLEMATGEGGILASEFAIDEKFADGNFTLAVRPVDLARTTVQPAAQRLEIVREVRLPDFQFDQDRYLPGDQVTGIYRGLQRLPKQAIIGQEAVPFATQPVVPMTSALPAFGGGGPGAGAPESKAKGGPAPFAAQRFTAKIPLSIPPGAERVAMTLPLADGKKNGALRAEIPLAPTDFAIDFYPEGGDLIAGISNRVFYRVRAKSGESITGDGQVMLLTGKNGIVDSPYQLGMGYLDFVPNGKETYSVRITTPAKVQEIAAPFANLGIKTDGVVIQIASLEEDRAPSAVGNQGDPIRLTLRQQGPTRKLLVLAQCRGQVVDQRWVEIRREPVDLTLEPTQEAVGMIRLTAYEVVDGTLQPVAERLVYRAATRRLDLGITLNTQQINAGQKVTGRIAARDEKGQPAANWILASVVDERYQSRPRSLSAYFFLLNEIRTGADLDNAQLILHDSPESTQVLERFLGTHGWRRFVRSDEPTTIPPAGDAEPLVFSRENMPLDGMQKRYEDKLARALPAIHEAGFGALHEMEAERDRAAEAVVLAATSLRNLEDQVQLWIRLGMGTLLAVLLGASLILMGVGVYRIVRDHKAATPAFGSAFGCLTACLGLMFVGIWMGPPTAEPMPSLAAVHGPAAWEVRAELTKKLGDQMPVAQLRAGGVETGTFKVQNAGKADSQLAHANANPAKKVDDQAMKDASKALRDQLVQMFVRRERGDAFASADRKSESKDRLAENEALKKVYEEASKAGDKASADVALPIGPKAKVDKGTKSKKGDTAKADPPKGGAPPPAAPLLGRRAEYAAQYKEGLQADTLLWHPALWLPNGDAEVRFDLAGGNATYRVLLLGHSPAGRFGFHEQRLDVLGR